MEYLTGYTIKPFRTTAVGVVIFTDGTNNYIRANQQQCQAYGYTYDRATGTCRAFRPNTNFQRNINNINNKINGAKNTIGTGGKNVHINGTNNFSQGLNNNCFINGNANTIANGVSNAVVVGNNGTAIRDGEFVVGSTNTNNSTFFLTGRTTDAVSTSLFVDGNTDVETIEREENTVYSFVIDIIGYRTGGASGSGAIGDRKFLKVEGIVVGTDITQATTSIASFGTVVGWTAVTGMVGEAWKVKVTGATGMVISWQATAHTNKMTI
jgi:hypothetical protein